MPKQISGDLLPELEELSEKRIEAIRRAAFAKSDEEWLQACTEAEGLDMRIKEIERQIQWDSL